MDRVRSQRLLACRSAAAPPSLSAHNDQFIVVTHEDLFRVVEAVVQRRIEQEIAPLLTNPVPNPATRALGRSRYVRAAPRGTTAFPTGYNPGYFELWGMDLFGKCQWLRGFFPFAALYTIRPSPIPNRPDRRTTIAARLQSDQRPAAGVDQHRDLGRTWSNVIVANRTR